MRSKWNEQKEEAEGASASHRSCEDFTSTGKYKELTFLFSSSSFDFFQGILYYYVLQYRCRRRKLFAFSEISSTAALVIKVSKVLTIFWYFFKNGHFFLPSKIAYILVQKIEKLFISRQSPCQRSKLFFSGLVYTGFQEQAEAYRIKTKIDKDFINAKNICVSYR